MAAHAFDLMTLLDAPGVGPGRVRKLLKHWRNTPEVPVIEDRLIKGVLTPAQIAALPECRDRFKRHWDELLKQNVSMLSIRITRKASATHSGNRHRCSCCA
jgi:hypothetical protein